MSDTPQRGSGEQPEEPQQQAAGETDAPKASADTPPAGFSEQHTTQSQTSAGDAYGATGGEQSGRSGTGAQGQQYGAAQQGTGRPDRPDAGQAGTDQIGTGPYGTEQYGAGPYGAGQHGVGQAGTGEYGAGQSGIGQYGTVQYPQYPGTQSGAAAYGAQEPGIGGAPSGHYPYMGTPPNQGWQQQPHPPMGAVPVQQERRRRRGSTVGVALGGALLIGLLGGGIGGYVGYHFGSNNGSSAVTSLEQQPPARSASNAPQGSVQGVAQKVLPSVVQLQIQSAEGSGEGSGIVLSPDGYILTNSHVAQSAQQGRLTAVFSDSRTASVRVIGSDPSSDLAVVKADINGLQPADLGRSDDLPVGAPVVAIGSPFGLSGTVPSGIISAKNRAVRAGGQSGDQSSVLNALQTDAAINPGNSGGPLVDMDGRVVGINSAIYSPGSSQEQGGSVGLGFAIPIDHAKRIATELKNTGSATHTTLGVGIVSANQPGALVRTVAPGGAAQRAGVQPGQLITKFDGRTIEDADSLIAAVRSHTPGQKVPMTTVSPNGGGEQTVEVVLTGEKR